MSSINLYVDCGEYSWKSSAAKRGRVTAIGIVMMSWNKNWPALLLLLFSGSVFAQSIANDPAENYPNKPVRIIIPFSAGGGNDVTARIVTQQLTQLWMRTIVVDNRDGANGIIGSNIVAKANPDGYTLLVVSTSFAINPAMKRLPFDSVRDFSPIALFAETPIILVGSPSFSAKSLKELISLAKTKPGEITYASSGLGGANHLAGELMQSMSGVSLLHVPYKGGGDAVRDVVGGRVNAMFVSLPTVVSHIKNGKMIAIGIGDTRRSSLLPETPTLSEQGLEGYKAGYWFGLMGPAKMEKALIKKIGDDVNLSLQNKDVVQRLSSQGLEPVIASPEEFAKMVNTEILKWSGVVSRAGISEK